jgi:hypothetical protein
MTWRRPSRRGDEDSAEVALRDGRVTMRRSRWPEDEILAFTPAGWEAFTAAVKAGEFDLAALAG